MFRPRDSGSVDDGRRLSVYSRLLKPLPSFSQLKRYERQQRHAPLLFFILGLLLLIGILHVNFFDDVENSHDGEVRELRYEKHGLWTFLFASRDRCRAAQRAPGRHEFPFVPGEFDAEDINEDYLSWLSDVRDTRTLASDDFFEQMNLLRQPGSSAAQASKLVEALTENEKFSARGKAKRKRMLSKTQKSSTSLLDLLLGGSTGKNDGDEDATVVHYPSSLALHYLNSSTSFYLSGNDVQLVPYPWVPPPVTPRDADAIVKNKKHPDRNAEKGSAADGNSTNSTITVTIPKGKIRSPVPHRTTPHTPAHGWDHFYIAMNLWENEDVLPDLTEALIVFLEEEVKPFFDLATSVVVSIYATISSDKTAELISTLLIPRLHAAGVRRVYATTEGTCLGYAERQRFHERIEWMACVRNKALHPLYKKGMSLFERSPPQEQASAEDEDNAEGLVVLFFNDIFFRPQDITRLLESRAESQIAATTRPHGWISAAGKPSVKTAGGADVGTTFDMACGMDFYFSFYDTWVTRDRLGGPFHGQMPYSRDHPTQEAFYRILHHERSKSDGRGSGAIPVKCCWNGVAAVRGRFFLTPTPSRRRGFPAPTAAEGAHSSVARSPEVLRSPSGALYDRIGKVQDVLNQTELARHYLRVLARRLDMKYALWSKKRREIVAPADVPFYEPEMCNQSSSFEKFLQALVEDETQGALAPGVDWTQIRVQYDENVLFLDDAAVKILNTSYVGPGGLVVLNIEEDSIYYRARYPSIRFRHSFTPSYGSTVAGPARVRDDVCLSSECLLICQDVMQAAILQDGRAPIILLNPLVRVAYNPENFRLITQHAWYYNNPYVYWGWTLLLRARLLEPFSLLSSIYYKYSNANPPVEDRRVTSATDDWLIPTSVAATQGKEAVTHAVQKLSLQDGDGQVRGVGYIDIPTLTQMNCQNLGESDIEAIIGSLLLLVRMGQLLTVALLFWWLCWQIEDSMVAAVQSNSDSAAEVNRVEELERSALCRTVWPFKSAPRLWICSGRAPLGRGSRLEAKLAEKMKSVRSCVYSCITRLHTSSAATVPPPLRRLWTHLHQKKTLRWISDAVRRIVRLVAHTLMWLFRKLCCVGLGRGSPSGTRPLDSPHKQPNTDPLLPRSNTSSALVPEPGYQKSPPFVVACRVPASGSGAGGVGALLDDSYQAEVCR
ncbi:hypothetical protein JKF63_06290 [Porcisia hertigi]|uniref:Uncharacterized protein n=1 Tax=Porcisia hertigi TaxID=2761500 RepID=A0A836LH62_9TRYP|nr:hypothetical protein JKF63_06290 [Porcisia hertigi]